ncbi:aspartic proteinase nepenthesin-1-like [Phragmites australis]|uniref:aspartic proteinase nepenthesin-1-like n=1 Tax=Phragmites australis TaxID=29695 RepID=UPI002D798C10|nr:aspartic proteinase nepenthesin-1-like [Phragmites australis]
MARHLHLLPLLCLAVVVAAAPAYAIFHFGFSSELEHPYGGSSYSRHEIWRRAALGSKARVARHRAMLAQVLGKSGDISAADVTFSPHSDLGYWLTVGIGTPPQPSKLILDTGSNLIWTQCKLFSPTAGQLEPLYDPGKSSSFAVLPCSSRLCQEGLFTKKNCTDNRCLYEDRYDNAVAGGFLASETFTFGVHRNVSLSLGFGCGALTGGSIAGATGVLGLCPGTLSLVAQQSVPRFSYCLTPFAERKTSPLLFGATADLRKYRTAGPIQTTSLLRNPVANLFYYVPLLGLSLGAKRLDLPAASLALNPDGTGGTVIDTGSTLAYLVEPAFEEVKKAVLEMVKLPVADRTVEEYQLCFALPRGMSMDKVQTPPLVLHFDGGAEMVLPRDNYFQEPSPGLMCLAVGKTSDSSAPSVIGNVQQQNMHVLYDVGHQKLSFAPTQCDEL